MSFAESAAGYPTRLAAVLDGHLPPADEPPRDLHRAMRYATLDGGKRLRALLVYATAEALERPAERVDAAAAAVELIHAYSLVHDDLPAMDDDDLRRGKPSCHKAFGEATAILAGDALQTLAFRILARDEAAGDPAQRLRQVELLAEAAGSRGMAGGQAIDLAAAGRALSLDEVETMHRRKTGALIRASVLMPCHAGPAPETSRLAALERYAECLGLAFQIQDDILDESGDPAAMGKSRGADAARGKPTYTSMVGLDTARARARDLYREARDALAPFGAAAGGLHWLARRIVDRED
ncbi:polyprenyl synthetase [Salinisphaera sp. PC39]|uniref:polyprenyl synthetase family protein n=1 Tax=Salinisphaera sp. PC39 TaxID=1304156 RepID=UPI00334140CA